MGLLSDYYAKNKKQSPFQQPQQAASQSGTQRVASGGGMLSQYQKKNKLETPFQVAPVKQVARTPVKITQTPVKQVTKTPGNTNGFLNNVRKWIFEPPKAERQQVMLPTTLKIEKRPLKQIGETKQPSSAQMTYDPNARSVVPKAVKEKVKVADDVTRSLVTGAADVQVAAGTTLQWMGAKGVGARMARDGKKVQQYAPPTDLENLSWKTLFDPQYYNDYLNSTARAVPLMASLIPAAIIGTYAGTTTAGAIGLGAFGKFILGSIGAAALSRPIESALEAGGTYDEALQRGKSEEEAHSAANNTFLKNLLLTGADAGELALAFLPGAKGKLIKNVFRKLGGGAASALLSGAEEIAQSAINAQSQGDAFDIASPESVSSAVTGALVGTGLPLASSTLDLLKTETITAFDQEGKRIYQKYIDQGMDADEASLRTVDELADKHPEEVKEIINTTLSREIVKNKVFTPDEALAFTMETGVDKTEEGKQINLTVLQAKQEGKSIRIIPSEDGGIESLELVDPNQTPEMTQEEGAQQLKGDTGKEVKEEDIVNPIDRNASQEEKVKQLTALTDENEPIINDFIKEIDKELGTTSYSNRKKPERILAKANRPDVKAKKPWHDVEHIRDSFRFKTVLNDLSDVETIGKKLAESGIEIVKLDTEKMLKPKPWGFRFVAFDLRMKNGQLVEYYATLKGVQNAMDNGNHQLFEDWRNTTEEYRQEHQEEYFKAIKDSRAKYDEAWNDYLSSAGLDESAVVASWNKVATSLASSIDSNESNSSGDKGATASQEPSVRSAESGGLKTNTRSVSGSEATIGESSITNPPSTSSVAQSEQKGKRVLSTKEEPVGTGRQKNSRLFERVKETLGSEFENENRKYNVLDLEKQARFVADLIENDPEKAVKIARGREEPPSGVTQNAVAVGLAEVARSKEDFTTAARLWTETSLRSTRLGQEIVSLRGEFSGNESLNAVKAILNVRMTDVARRYSDVIKGLSVPDDAPIVKKVDALVTHQAKRAKKEIAKRQAAIQSAQDILNELMCKV